MAAPNSRATLIDYCKRRLGEPVIEVNVDEDQLEDRVWFLRVGCRHRPRSKRPRNLPRLFVLRRHWF